MRYKSEYSPSYLLDPGTLQFHHLTAQLDKYLQAHPTGYHPFTNIAESKDIPPPSKKAKESPEEGDDSDSEFEEEDEFLSPPPPGFGDPASYTQNQIDRMLVLMKGGSQAGSKTRVVPLGVSPYYLKQLCKACTNDRHSSLSVRNR
jgi:arginine-tRNA-protein transferase